MTPKLLLQGTTISMLLFLLFLSCQKEKSCENCRENSPDGNKPPIAVAGVDQTIRLPKDSVVLDGSASSDADGQITKYNWIKISGPQPAKIAAPNTAKTIVRPLAVGVYQFELTVTDDGGLSAKDTVRVLVDSAGNSPPTACATADTVILLPLTTANLDGTCSTDPENNIAGYLWTQIAGPSAASLVRANEAKTEATHLEQGVYLFELKVTDAMGFFSKDTVQIRVREVAFVADCGNNFRPVIFVGATLVATHTNLIGGAVAAGNKIIFAGGHSRDNKGTANVDIYDVGSNTWTAGSLSKPRIDPTVVAAGDKVFFAGGSTGKVGTMFEEFHAVVDIYDIRTGAWTNTSLKYPCRELSAAAVGNKVLFAGGSYRIPTSNVDSWGAAISNEVEIYDISTGKWATAYLSEKRFGPSVATAGAKVFFAGGYSESPGRTSNRIDIYDNASGTWSTSELSKPKVGMSGVAQGSVVYWAGGYDGFKELCDFEIHDLAAQEIVMDHLSTPGMGSAILKDNKVYCYRGKRKFDVYDLALKTWFVAFLPESTPEAGSVVLVNNTFYLAGGGSDVNGSFVYSNKIFRLNF